MRQRAGWRVKLRQTRTNPENHNQNQAKVQNILINFSVTQTRLSSIQLDQAMGKMLKKSHNVQNFTHFVLEMIIVSASMCYLSPQAPYLSTLHQKYWCLFCLLVSKIISTLSVHSPPQVFAPFLSTQGRDLPQLAPLTFCSVMYLIIASNIITSFLSEILRLEVKITV